MLNISIRLEHHKAVRKEEQLQVREISHPHANFPVCTAEERIKERAVSMTKIHETAAKILKG